METTTILLAKLGGCGEKKINKESERNLNGEQVMWVCNQGGYSNWKLSIATTTGEVKIIFIHPYFFR